MLAIHQTEQEAAAQFERAMDELRDSSASFSAETIYSLSDLSGKRLATFRQVWAELGDERRRDLVKRLVETTETNFELDFRAIINSALNDTDAEIRRMAVEGVLEDSAPSVIERVIKLATSDPFSAVRAAAVRALGQFVLRGELGKLPGALNKRLQDAVLARHYDLNEDPDVRRRALESIANCGREGVEDLIREAYVADELRMRVSAVFAMGRTCDDMWQPQVLDELSSEHPEMRYEAARAAGELELKPALRRLAELAYEDDIEIQEMAIWALGEIGGNKADQVLASLAALAEETDDVELAEAVADAQAAALLAAEDVAPLFDFSDLDGDLDEGILLDDADAFVSLETLVDDEDDEDDETDAVYDDFDY